MGFTGSFLRGEADNWQVGREAMTMAWPPTGVPTPGRARDARLGDTKRPCAPRSLQECPEAPEMLWICRLGCGFSKGKGIFGGGAGEVRYIVKDSIATCFP